MKKNHISKSLCINYPAGKFRPNKRLHLKAFKIELPSPPPPHPPTLIKLYLTRATSSGHLHLKLH